MIRNLIPNDVTRCSNTTCDLRKKCKRFLQKEIDNKNNTVNWMHQFDYNAGDSCFIPSQTFGISVEDVVKVAEDLKMNPSLKEISKVLSEYEVALFEDTAATWDLVVENLLYKHVKK